MRARTKFFRYSALAVGVSLAFCAKANPQGLGEGGDPGASFALRSVLSQHSLIDLPPVVRPPMVLVAAAGNLPGGLFFDPSQVSPLGDAAWVAALRGPDTSQPSITVNRAETPGSLGRGGSELFNIPGTGFNRSDAAVRNGQVLSNGRVYLIGAERSGLSKGGSIVLAPGRGAELGDLRVPYVRVYVTAPTGKPLDVDALVRRSTSVGMFSALFAPQPARRGDSGGTALASVSIPAAGAAKPAASNAVQLAVQIASVEERSVVLQPLRPAAVEDRVLVASVSPVEERSAAATPIPPASIEERSVVAWVTPVEDRSMTLAAIPPAAVEDRVLIAFAAPVEDRAMPMRPLVPAAVEDRVVLAFAAPAEERSFALGTIPPASVEDRSFVAYVVPVDERSGVHAAIPPARVEERVLVAFAAPVEDRATPLRPLVPAAVEERAPVLVARAEMAKPVTPEIGKPLPAEQVVSPVANIGKPMPGSDDQALLAAAKTTEPTTDTGLIRVAINPLHAARVVVVSSRTASSESPANPPVRIGAVQKRLPNVMFDRKGGFFFM